MECVDTESSSSSTPASVRSLHSIGNTQTQPWARARPATAPTACPTASCAAPIALFAQLEPSLAQRGNIQGEKGRAGTQPCAPSRGRATRGTHRGAHVGTPPTLGRPLAGPDPRKPALMEHIASSWKSTACVNTAPAIVELWQRVQGLTHSSQQRREINKNEKNATNSCQEPQLLCIALCQQDGKRNRWASGHDDVMTVRGYCVTMQRTTERRQSCVAPP